MVKFVDKEHWKLNKNKLAKFELESPIEEWSTRKKDNPVRFEGT